jgi:hypothetical protein
MGRCGVVKELIELVDRERDVWPSKCAVLKGTNDVSIQGGVWKEIAISCSEAFAGSAWGRVWQPY